MLPVIHFGPFTFYTFGLLFGLAVCLGWKTFIHYFRIHGIRVNEPVLGACLVGFGYLGAKLDNSLIRSLFSSGRHGSFFARLIDLQGGYTYLGCVLAGTLAGITYAIWNGLPLWRFLDSLFCIGPAYALGRIGCFLAGDGDYGVPSNLPWAISFPNGIVPTTVRVHPTMLYSSAWEMAVFAVLWRLSDPHRQRQPRPGTLLGCYLIASGAGRFLVEFLSRNPRLAFGLTEAQVVSTLMMAGGALALGRVYLSVTTGTTRLTGRRPLQARPPSEAAAVCRGAD